MQTYAYEFDDFGNRTSLTATGEDAYTTAYSYDANNRLLEDVKTEAGTETRTTYFYDPNGNQISKSIETLSTSSAAASTSLTDEVASYELNWYNGFNQLAGTKANGITAEYSYAPSGLRLSKTIDDVQTDFVLDGGNVIAEQRGNTLTAYYARGINLFASFIGDTASFYLYNAHGDVVQLTDENGAVTKTYEYDAFGNEQDPSAVDTNPFRYCGEYFDAETGTYYLRARYYDPVIGRMIAEDPAWNYSNRIYGEYYYADTFAILQSGNLYVYCNGNPILFIDPFGFEFYASAFDLDAGFSLGLGSLGKFYAGTDGAETPRMDIGVSADINGSLVTFGYKGKTFDISITCVQGSAGTSGGWSQTAGAQAGLNGNLNLFGITIAHTHPDPVTNESTVDLSVSGNVGVGATAELSKSGAKAGLSAGAGTQVSIPFYTENNSSTNATSQKPASISPSVSSNQSTKTSSTRPSSTKISPTTPKPKVPIVNTPKNSKPTFSNTNPLHPSFKLP